MPFISKKDPLVLLNRPRYMPFVCLKKPFVSFNASRGFTIIELIITVVVAAILITFIVPNVRPVLLNSRMTAQTNDLISDIQIARSEAIRRNSRVFICSSTTGTTCDGSGWNSGRLIFDASATGANGPSAANTIRFHEPMSGDIWSDAATTFPDPLRFDSRGTPIQVNGRPLSEAIAMPVLFVLCETQRNILGRQLSLNGVGQVVTSKYTC